MPNDETVDAGRGLQAVLFDMDGTLVDTEPHWMAAEYELVEQHGGTWNDDHANALVGSDLIRAAEYLRDVGGVELAPPTIVGRMLDSVIRGVGGQMPWRPGARELLTECRAAGVPCAMVTMSYRSLAETLVRQLPPDTFATIVTGDDVRHGKPHPEAYLTACARLGVEPAATVAIEDSPTGVASAEAAGCVAVAVPFRVPVSAAPGRVLAGSLAELTLADLTALVARRAAT
ncbi:HAD family hydrolase [uncultured Jatrophihabitans sp.]|uniref:HAD family hydrolase n=1 Tax=uncultured Jatrophihabitans sp. TaxID=1610747 RepID=UPI0035CAB8B4